VDTAARERESREAGAAAATTAPPHNARLPRPAPAPRPADGVTWAAVAPHRPSRVCYGGGASGAHGTGERRGTMGPMRRQPISMPGWNEQAAVAILVVCARRLLAAEPPPLTPDRLAHLVAESTFPQLVALSMRPEPGRTGPRGRRPRASPRPRRPGRLPRGHARSPCRPRRPLLSARPGPRCRHSRPRPLSTTHAETLIARPPTAHPHWRGDEPWWWPRSVGSCSPIHTEPPARAPAWYALRRDPGPHRSPHDPATHP